jgi:hypothetical protein
MSDYERMMLSGEEVFVTMRASTIVRERIAELEAELHIAEVWRVRAEQAEAELAALKATPREPLPGEIDHEMLRQHNEALQAELAALKAVAEAMEEFIDSCTYHMLNGNTVNYDGPRAEEGGEE